MGIALNTGEHCNNSLPHTTLVHEDMLRLIGEGYTDLDHSALIMAIELEPIDESLGSQRSHHGANKRGGN